MWVVDMEKKLDAAETSAKVAKVAKWSKHCIFRVPPRFKTVDGGSVYRPRTVALGPFHHNDADLRHMEEHKLRAVRHLLRRADKKLDELRAAMDAVADELEDAYMDLDDSEWSGEANRGRFLAMMIADGCFLLELMRPAVDSKSYLKGYVPADPVFSWHGIQHIKSFVQRDMLMIENQLPLKVLETIMAVETGKPPNDGVVSSMVLRFLCWGGECDPQNVVGGGGDHPLGVYRRSVLINLATRQVRRALGTAPARWEAATPRSAQKLADAGIRFRASKTKHLNDIHFDDRHRTLEMPKVYLDDSTAYKYQNMMALEAMHVGTSNDVTAFVLFIKDVVDSADDVSLLKRKKIINHDLAIKAVVKLVNDLTKDVPKNWDSYLCHEREKMQDYYKNKIRRKMFEHWAAFKNKYFRSPWTFIALLAAVFLLVTDIIQTAYGVKSYDIAEKTPPPLL